MMDSKRKQQIGFTLIELMITVVIIGILGAIAFPSYQNSLRKAKRTEAKTALLQTMARQEQFFSENRSYTDDVTLIGQTVNGTDSEFVTENEHYRITLVPIGTNMIIAATPIGGQAEDTYQRFLLYSNGQKQHSLSSSGAPVKPGWDE